MISKLRWRKICWNRQMKKIYEIGEKTGFFNASAFTIFFKRETGVSPKEYRQNYFNSWKEHSLTI